MQKKYIYLIAVALFAIGFFTGGIGPGKRHTELSKRNKKLDSDYRSIVDSARLVEKGASEINRLKSELQTENIRLRENNTGLRDINNGLRKDNNELGNIITRLNDSGSYTTKGLKEVRERLEKVAEGLGSYIKESEKP